MGGRVRRKEGEIRQHMPLIGTAFLLMSDRKLP